MGRKLYVGNLPFSATEKSSLRSSPRVALWNQRSSSPIATRAEAKASASSRWALTAEAQAAIASLNGQDTTVADHGQRSASRSRERAVAAVAAAVVAAATVVAAVAVAAATVVAAAAVVAVVTKTLYVVFL